MKTQAGRNPYASDQTAAHLMSPGPLTHNGPLKDTQAAEVSAKTFDITNAILTELAGTMTSPADRMTRHWHTHMNWFGPAGIGACLGFAGYRRGHTGLFEERQDFVDCYQESAATATTPPVCGVPASEYETPVSTWGLPLMMPWRKCALLMYIVEMVISLPKTGSSSLCCTL
ncbi:hypothetical protein AB833_31630 [Chromatiales bacterium (ex Bugula neritina AB1)]|nr:hypothetical protein AB833_31630 [Chromatiales bacterium (ex Bugula neritina AB1)]